MFKFFRSIRQRLFREGKVRGYFGYAMGEVILIVVGILLALQISDWNERRKQAQYLKYVIGTIITDFQNDSEEIRALQDFYRDRMESNRKLMIGEMTVEEVKECKTCFGAITELRILSLNDSGINLLGSLAERRSSEEDELLNEMLNEYSNIRTTVNVLNPQLEKEVFDNLNFMSKQPWFVRAVANRPMEDDPIEFITTDPEFRSRLAVFQILIENNLLQFLKDYEAFIEKYSPLLEESYLSKH